MAFSSSTTRTNSLAFAQTDCHTCTAHQRQCNRKRPRCSTCSSNGILCGGYPMQLRWPRKKSSQTEADPSMNRGNGPFYIEPLSLRTSVHAPNGSNRSLYHSYRKLAFVTEKIPDLKQNYAPSSDIRERKKPASSCENQPQPPPQSTPFRRATPDDHSAQSPLVVGLKPMKNTDHEQVRSSNEGQNDCVTMGPSTADKQADSIFIDPQLLITLRTPVLNGNLCGKYEPLLSLYDQEFCIVPLSGDILSNPLRCRIGTSQESQCLLHAILAVSCYHICRRIKENNYSTAEIEKHHNIAETLYRKELDAFTDLSQGARLLDTTMILFLFRATQSALNDWTTQISHAGRLLGLCGGPGFWANNRRTQAQVALLLWWDANIALLSRQGCILPYAYFESLVNQENDKYWTFFNLVGCPRELVVYLMQLTNLAQENEQVLSMRWTNFDSTVVNDIQASITTWEDPGMLTMDDNTSEELMQQQRDRYHCAEAWRYGLLIYIARVFQWDRSSNPPKILAMYARLIFEHVQGCRRTSIIAKQAFFPLFLAGCETRDRFLRQSIREFCKYWDIASGYNLFRGALSLLEDVWREQKRPSGDDVWWGSVIDKKQQINQLQGVQMQFCLG